MACCWRKRPDKLIDQERTQQQAIEMVEQNGIAFIDEIDKITIRNDRHGGDVSREGVQRDLLPLIEGTTVSTKYGAVKTDHILFVASGAFHQAKPSDLLAELQGRLPIRVNLNPLTEEDFGRILREPENSLIKQYVALMGTEAVTLNFTEDAIDRIAALSAQINQTVRRISARAGCTRSWKRSWKRSVSPPPTAAARRSRSPRPMSTNGSATSPPTRT